MVNEKRDDVEQKAEQDQACFLSLVFVLVMLVLKNVYEDELNNVIGIYGAVI